MPTTSPDNIYFADGSTPMSAEDISAAEATSVQDALDNLINDNRQIQTFVWANSAARTAQTGMIAGDFGYQTDTGVTYRYNGSAWVAFYPGGLVPVVPTSVAGTGVSFDSTTGLVTFTAATSLSVNGCFTSDFAHYKIIASVTARSTPQNSAIVLRASGVDLSTGYDLSRSIFTTVLSQAQFANGSSFTLASGNFPKQQYEIEFRQPQLAQQTGALIRVVEVNTAAAPTIVAVDGSTRSTAAYDGFTIINGAGTFTGTLKVYGYN